MRKSCLVAATVLAGSWTVAAQQPAGAFSIRTVQALTSNVRMASSLHSSAAYAAGASAHEIMFGSPPARGAYAPSIAAMINSVETPFADTVHVSLASFVGGRLRFGGYHSTLSSSNILYGLPGGGALSPRGIGLQSHLASHAPCNMEMAGFEISFHWHGSEPSGAHFRASQVLDRAFSFVHSI